MIESEYRLNGIPLSDEGRGWLLQSASTFRKGVTMRRQSLELPGRPGELLTSPPWGVEAGALSFDWLISAASVSQLDATCNDLISLLAAPGGRMERITSGLIPSTLVADVALQSTSERSGLVVSPGGGATCGLTALMRVPGALWHASQPITKDLTAGTVQIPTDATAPTVSCVVRVTGPATHVQVRDLVSGTSITWEGSIPAGTFAFIDCKTLMASTSSSPEAWELFKSISASVGYLPGGPLMMTPTTTSGGRSYSVESSIIGDGSVSLRFYPSYY